MSYVIHPANVPGTTEFNSLSITPDSTCIIKYKFTFDTLNAVAVSLLTTQATATNLGISNAFALTETSPLVKISFAFVGTEYHDLVGVHDLTLKLTLKDHPYFDYFIS